MRGYLESVGVVGPGLPGWPASRGVLAGRSDYQPGPVARFKPDILPANERRRITPTIRIAMQAATEAMAATPFHPRDTASVFVSTNGDLDISDRICTALTMPARPVSPTDFHNSVHNAPAGYWAIGTGCRLSSTSLSAGAASFAAGLLEGLAQTLTGGRPVLLVAYDLPPPPPLVLQQRLQAPFAAGLVLNNRQTGTSLAALRVERVEQQGAGRLSNEALEPLRLGNPAAQGLLLLELVAKQATAQCVLPYLDSSGLLVDYMPC